MLGGRFQTLKNQRSKWHKMKIVNQVTALIADADTFLVLGRRPGRRGELTGSTRSHTLLIIIRDVITAHSILKCTQGRKINYTSTG